MDADSWTALCECTGCGASVRGGSRLTCCWWYGTASVGGPGLCKYGGAEVEEMCTDGDDVCSDDSDLLVDLFSLGDIASDEAELAIA